MDQVELVSCLRALKMPCVLEYFADYSERAGKEQWSFERYLYELLNMERENRTERRIQKLMRESKLPLGKTLDALDRTRFPRTINQQIDALLEGSFLERYENVLVFGNPGAGKSHAVCAIAHQLVLQGHRVVFKNCEMLVQELLIAKRDLALPALLRKLRRYEALIIDDIGYVQQNREEMEVLFTLLADRYERASTMITSNLPFSKWEKIFKDPMTTAAAIDRLVHHSMILELNLTSYRLEQARKEKRHEE
jgi:DNA replication protein DnaC|tara:strand:- start:446 stop:1198 length:753 start_codon:yes stop_codon:yes gene_type:complete